jgi:hypothetical protein
MTSLYIIYYTYVWPHSIKRYAIIEVFNEVLFMCLNYHMLLFSPFTDLKIHHDIGNSYLFTMSFLFLINLIFVSYNSFYKYIRKKQLFYMKTVSLNKARTIRETREASRKSSVNPNRKA